MCAFLFSQTNFEMFKDYSAVYVPDENRTYFMEGIKIEKVETEERIVFENLKGYISGNYSRLIIENDPTLRPIVKSDYHRKVERSGIGTPYGVTCVPGGFICVILFPKKKLIDD